MLTQTSDTIIRQLEQTPGVKTVGEWAGDVEDLLKKPHNLPSLHLIYGGGVFGKGPVAMGSKIAGADQTWTVIVLSKNLRSRQDGALEAYTLIEAVRGALTKFAVAGGWLWPEREALIFAERGILGYGIDFTLSTETE